MGTFNASLRAIGDVNAIPATLEIDDGTLSIAAGETEIGSWQLSDIHLEPIATGYRLAAEGDQILIEMKDTDSFAAALNVKKKPRLLKAKKTAGSSRPGRGERSEKARGRKKAKTASEESPPVEAPEGGRIRIADEPAAPIRVPVEPTSASPSPDAIVLPPAPKTAKPTTDERSFGGKVIDWVDSLLVKSNKRFGAYLPQWVFTRAVFGALVLGLVLFAVFPGPASVILLILGVVGILYGAVAYSDPMLASRWLPGRTTPPQVLLAGLSVLLVGILLGMLSG